MRTLIDLGANIDRKLPCIPVHNSFFLRYEPEICCGDTLLIHIFNNGPKYKKCFRKVVELFLYKNVSLAENSSAVSTAIKQYRNWSGEMSQPDHSSQTGTYIMDAILHENVFTCTIPLLVEAGFKYSLTDIEDALELFKDSSLIANFLTSSEDPVLHVRRTLRNHEKSMPQNPVKAYLLRCLSEPRPLILQCRDVLRTHFPRREIRIYVSVMNIPNRIKDFLLLKTILQRLPVDIKPESDNRNESFARPSSKIRQESIKKLQRLPVDITSESDNRNESIRRPSSKIRQESIRKSLSDNRYDFDTLSQNYRRGSMRNCTSSRYRSRQKFAGNIRSKASCQIV